MGLAMEFNDLCPQPNWAHGMQMNSMKGLAAAFRDMRQQGLTPDHIRALIHLYFQRLGARVPANPYWLDFKGSRWRLLKILDESGTMRTGRDYEDWQAHATGEVLPSATEFAAGWHQ